MAVTWVSMERYFVTRLPEIPVPVLHAEVLTAARRFYTETRAWRDATPRLPDGVGLTAVDQANYTVDMPVANSEIVGVCEAWLDSDRLTEARNEQTVENDNLDGGPPVSGTPTHIRVFLPTQYRLLPTPNVAGKVVKAAFAYRPSTAATGLEDVQFYDHYEAIVELTVATCAMHRGQKWSDPVGAQVAMGAYNCLAIRFGSRAGSVGRRIRTKTHIF